MKLPLLMLGLAPFATTSPVPAQGGISTDNAFKMQPLVITSALNTARTARLYHIFLGFHDTSYYPDVNTTCDVYWTTNETPPTEPIQCSNTEFALSVSNFKGLKNFDLGLGHTKTVIKAGTNVTPGNLIPPGGALNFTESVVRRFGSISITTHSPTWKSSRTHSGGSVRAVADGPVYVPILDISEDGGR